MYAERSEAAFGAAAEVLCPCGKVSTYAAHQVLRAVQSGPQQWVKGLQQEEPQHFMASLDKCCAEVMSPFLRISSGCPYVT